MRARTPDLAAWCRPRAPGRGQRRPPPVGDDDGEIAGQELADDTARRRVGDGYDDQADDADVDVAFDPPLEALEVFLGIAYQRHVARLEGGRLDARQNSRRVGADKRRKDDADVTLLQAGTGFLPAQELSRGRRAIPQLLRRLEHALPGLRRDPGVAVEGQRDRRRGDTRQFSHIANRQSHAYTPISKWYPSEDTTGMPEIPRYALTAPEVRSAMNDLIETEMNRMRGIEAMTYPAKRGPHAAMPANRS